MEVTERVADVAGKARRDGQGEAVLLREESDDNEQDHEHHDPIIKRDAGKGEQTPSRATDAKHSRKMDSPSKLADLC